MTVEDYRHVAVRCGWARERVVEIDAYVGKDARKFTVANEHAIVLEDAARHSVWYRVGKVDDAQLPTATQLASGFWRRSPPKRAAADRASAVTDAARKAAKPVVAPKPLTAAQRAKAKRQEAADELRARQEPLTERRACGDDLRDEE